MPAISARLANWQLWWSLRNWRIGTTPSGAIKTSSSLVPVIWTCWTYFGMHSATYCPNSTSWLRTAASCLRTMAVYNKITVKIYRTLEKYTNLSVEYRLRRSNLPLVGCSAVAVLDCRTDWLFTLADTAYTAHFVTLRFPEKQDQYS